MDKKPETAVLLGGSSRAAVRIDSLLTTNKSWIDGLGAVFGLP